MGSTVSLAASDTVAVKRLILETTDANIACWLELISPEALNAVCPGLSTKIEAARVFVANTYKHQSIILARPITSLCRQALDPDRLSLLYSPWNTSDLSEREVKERLIAGFGVMSVTMGALWYWYGDMVAVGVPAVSAVASGLKSWWDDRYFDLAALEKRADISMLKPHIVSDRKSVVYVPVADSYVVKPEHGFVNTLVILRAEAEHYGRFGERRVMLTEVTFQDIFTVEIC